MNNVKEVSVRKNGHLFVFYVTDSGRIEYKIDNGKKFTAKELKDGKIYFIKKQELIINNELVEIDGLDLYDEDFSVLKQAQDAVLEEKHKKSMKKIEDENKESAECKELLRYVDSWKRKVYKYKDKNKQKQKYCVHDIRIGNDRYRFIERYFSEIGVVVNPDYKISEEVENVGGVPKKYGELIFWDYYFEGTGWKKVRVLTKNELICVEIIKNLGFFSTNQEK